MNKMKSPRPPTALHPAHAIAKAKRKKRPTGEDYCNRRRTYGFRRFSLSGFASLVFICSVLFLNSDRSRHPRHTFGLFGVCAPFQICFTQLPILHVYHWSEDERRPAGPVTSQLTVMTRHRGFLMIPAVCSFIHPRFALRPCMRCPCLSVIGPVPAPLTLLASTISNVRRPCICWVASLCLEPAYTLDSCQSHDTAAVQPRTNSWARRQR